MRIMQSGKQINAPDGSFVEIRLNLKYEWNSKINDFEFRTKMLLAQANKPLNCHAFLN